jgi:RNA polymerase sigma factor (sigma-70 family)
MPLHTIPLHAADEEILNNLLQEGVDRKRGEELLFHKYAYFIGQAVHKYSFPEEEASSLYSDTIIAAIPRIIDGSFERRSSLKTWLYQIFHNKCVDQVRKNASNKSSVHRTSVVSDIFLNLADPARSVLEEQVARVDRELIKQRLKETGENCRQLLWHWGEGLSDKEIAAIMAYKTADVVKTSRLRCLEKLRQLYKMNTK